MSWVEIVLAVLLGLAVNEFSDFSPWLASKLVVWSARLRYADSPRGQTRGEELAALIKERPGKLFKLATGTGFVSAALLFRLRRAISGETVDDLLSDRRLGPRLAEPTELVRRYLFPSEGYRGEWRRHWINPVRSLVIAATYLVLGVWATVLRIKPQYVGELVAGIVIACVLYAGYRVVDWHFNRFVITNKRLIMTSGILSRRVEMLPLARVTDMRYTQSTLGRVLDYGTFRLESAGRHDILRRIKDLPKPENVYLQLVEEIYEPEAVIARRGEYDSYSVSTDEYGPLGDDEFEPFGDDEYGYEPFAAAAAPDRRRPPPDPVLAQREITSQLMAVAAQLDALTAAVKNLSWAPADEPNGSVEPGRQLARPTDDQLHG
jgi:membrane protein YdbS with pleckstrin-like domain